MDATRRRDFLFATLRYGWAVPLVLLLTGFVSAAPALPAPDDSRRQAQIYEESGDWLEACRAYDEVIRKDRTNLAARTAYHRCLRQYQITRRHTDRTYREALTALEPAQALDIYESVLNTVAQTYVDRNKTEVDKLFKHGVQELSYALNQKVFLREHLTGAETAPAQLSALKNYLSTWPERKLVNRAEVRNLLLNLAAKAQQDGLVQNKGAFVVVLALEFAFGACTGLDEYTLFLTPQHYNAVQAALRGKFVGIGVDLAMFEQGLEITRIYPKSPAAEAMMPLHVGDRVRRIDQQLVEKERPEIAADLLRGDPDSFVELEVLTPGEEMPRTYRLQRRSVAVPSVDFTMIPDTMSGDYLGHLRITHFQESTVQEVKEALAQMHALGMKGLILDLRGNPGGSFLPAVKVAELFLPDGVIVNTSSQFDELNKPYQVKGGNPLLLPMCVLIDAETASSAELLAGALKENRRDVRFYGQTTFGKGSIQCIIPLKTTSGGLRITVAKFTSPGKHPYTNVGVTPHVTVDAGPNAVFNTALEELKTMLPRAMMGSM